MINAYAQLKLGLHVKNRCVALSSHDWLTMTDAHYIKSI